MGKLAGTGSSQKDGAVESATMAARSRSSRKSVSKPVSRGPALSNRELINIVMNGLNELQDRFGQLHALPPTDPGDPALLVLPLKLSVCRDETCGRIIESQYGLYCDLHKPKPVGPISVSVPFAGDISSEFYTNDGKKSNVPPTPEKVS